MLNRIVILTTAVLFTIAGCSNDSNNDSELPVLSYLSYWVLMPTNP